MTPVDAHQQPSPAQPTPAANWYSALTLGKVVCWLGVAGLIFTWVIAILGFPPGDFHEPWHYLGIMSPSCGVTRGVVSLWRGDIGLAWRYNPASFLVAATGLLCAAQAAVGVTSGRWLHLRTPRHGRLATAVVILALLVALEVNQQFHAELLMSRPG